MKLSHMIAAGGLLLSLSAPALAQMPPPNGDAGMHRNDPGPGPRGDMRGGPGGPGMHEGPTMGRGPGMHDGGMDRPPPHRRGYNGRHCRTVWSHHHRVRRCMR